MAGFFVQQGQSSRWSNPNGVILPSLDGIEVYVEQNGETTRRFVFGQNFESYLRSNRISLASYVRSLQEAAVSLRRIHQQDCTHGDIHMRNLIVDAHTMNVVWVDLQNNGTEASDWEAFRNMCHEATKNCGIEFRVFHAHLCATTDVLGFLCSWDVQNAHEKWDVSIIADILFAQNTPKTVGDIPKSMDIVQNPPSILEEECAAWEHWIQQGITGRALAQQFLEQFPPAYENPSLLQCIAEGILLNRLSQRYLALYEQKFGSGQSELRELLELAEEAIQAAQKVQILEEKIEQKEGLSWYERTFGTAKEDLEQLRIEFSSALQEREQLLPKLIPMARGLLDHQLATKVAQKKKEKLEATLVTEHAWKNWFPSIVYEPPIPIPLQRAEKTIHIDGDCIQFRLIPSGIDQNGMIHDQHIWVSVHLIHQSLFERVMNANPSRHLGERLPVHMVSYETALRFCNVLSQKNSYQEHYGFVGGRWYSTSANGFRLLTESEWNYALQAQSDCPENLFEYAWCCENSNNIIHPIGKKRPNAWGLYDMWGGMEEWIWSEDTNHSKRIGGSWYHDVRTLKSNEVHFGAEDLSSDTIGFRIAIVTEAFGKGEELG